MAQTIESWFICDGRYRIEFINRVGLHPERIIEIENIDTRERFHGADLELLAFSLIRERAQALGLDSESDRSGTD